jgi:hypothetical protein
MMTKMDIRRMGAFQNKRLESIFMKNQRVDPFIEINEFQDITFEDNIALFGIVDSDHIFHYFLLKLSDGYSIYSSYGSDSVSIYQYETKVTPTFFENFVKSLKKKTKNKTDKNRIRGFMRAHFLNPVFQLVQRKTDEYVKETVPEGSTPSMYMKNTPKDISDEIERYVDAVFTVIQFPSILPDIQKELTRYESIEKDEAEVVATESKAAEEEVVATESKAAEEEVVATESKAAEEEVVATELKAAEEEVVATELKAAEAEVEEDAEAEEAEEKTRVKEEAKGGMRQRRTRKGRRTHYVRSRRMYRRTLHKK